ncbi:hypothetical protein BV96_03969 [Sphingomonas paucimobilis]|nr:hypothetical protein BV96_03969 [Sphingomonas paucimobilis]
MRVAVTSASFYSDLAKYGSAPALLTPGGLVLNYAELASEAADFSDRLGSQRQLVFLELENTVSAVAAYLGCLMGGHAIYPFGAGDESKIERLLRTYRPNAVVRLEDHHMSIHRISEEAADLHPDLRLLLSTSGSTGSPKLVKLSHRNLQSNAEAIAEYLMLGSDERAITSLKPSYSYGLSVIHSHLFCGGSLLLTTDSVTERSFWPSFRDARCTSFAGVPYTFELLLKSGVDLSGFPDLRYATQAGGKLAAAQVERLARQSAKEGWRFYVMYGQTEAAPRIAYLPPDMAAEYPEAIGVPVPGGAMSLLDDGGQPLIQDGVAGELTYSGPNVMMGYADSREALAGDETPPFLLTGDIAIRHANGLFSIVGRKSRFVKPFGVRVNLEEVERDAAQIAPNAVATGDDDHILVAVPAAAQAQALGLARALASRYGLPEHIFIVCTVDPLPRLSNGKVDYRSLIAAHGLGSKAEVPVRRGFWDIVTSPSFYRSIAVEAAEIMGLRAQSWNSVAQIFDAFLGQAAEGGGSFADSNGDSMSYISVSLALEDYLGQLPAQWEHMSPEELEVLREQPAAF